MSDVLALLDRAHRMGCSNPSDPTRRTLYGDAAEEIRSLRARLADAESQRHPLWGDGYLAGKRDLAAKVKALLADSAKWHTKGVEVIPKQRIRTLLADALPREADSEPASETRDGGAGL